MSKEKKVLPTAWNSKIDKLGRVVIPKAARKLLKLKSDQNEIIIRYDDFGLRIYSAKQAVDEVQAILKKYKKPRELVSNELIKERRRDAKKEK